MAKAIGAMEDQYPHPLMLDPEQLMPYLRVNKRGVRFTAEYEAYRRLSNDWASLAHMIFILWMPM